ncbi:hypothetical protein HUO13_09285 [Saccharopolyspora erythraea]|nr:hypothetical protein HUO13_09285 [Saccharopolyspora erythraea]
MGVLLAVLALAATVLTGASASAATTPAPAVIPAADGGPAVVVVKMVDYRLLQPAFLPPGTYTFKAFNAGQHPHAVEIAGPDVSNARTAVVQSGEVTEVTVTLRPGVYDFWCPVGDHRQMGMQLYVKVG